MAEVLMIGIAGGTGSGKTTLTQRIKNRFEGEVAVVYHDSYYRRHDDLTYEERTHLNYDHPDALETDLLIDHLQKLREGKSIECPVYDFSQHNRSNDIEVIEPRKVIIVEGILIFQDPALRAQLDLKVFVDADADIRILRRLRRDLVERGRTVDSVISQYESTVKPMHNLFVEPTKQYADIIVPSISDTSAAADLIVQKIENHLRKYA